ncbi:MAG TPA: phosphotransferase [Puia sp.]|nr:phosphotransferase [Puia sp.]
MNNELIEKAALQFFEGRNLLIQSLGNGLIHHTYKVTDERAERSIVLQAINTLIFAKPEDILYNYDIIFQWLEKSDKKVSIPRPLPAHNGRLFWIDDQKNYWRANQFINHTFSPLTPENEKAAYTVAKCFAEFTSALAGLDVQKLKPIIPDFHNLSLRYKQFEDAVEKASIERLLKSTHVIAELRQRKKLVYWYESILDSQAYPERVMHHDCKISNILFSTENGRVICPVDLDTVMPGKFFSDIGDMIRSMSCSVDENSTQWEKIDIQPSLYKNIINGYLEGIGAVLTDKEKNEIHYSGLVMIYMQSLRFLTDYLNNDIYYKTKYPEQNLNRALNQLILLEKLESFLKEEYFFDPF